MEEVSTAFRRRCARASSSARRPAHESLAEGPWFVVRALDWGISRTPSPSHPAPRRSWVPFIFLAPRAHSLLNLGRAALLDLGWHALLLDRRAVSTELSTMMHGAHAASAALQHAGEVLERAFESPVSVFSPRRLRLARRQSSGVDGNSPPALDRPYTASVMLSRGLSQRAIGRVCRSRDQHRDEHTERDKFTVPEEPRFGKSTNCTVCNRPRPTRAMLRLTFPLELQQEACEITLDDEVLQRNWPRRRAAFRPSQ